MNSFFSTCSNKCIWKRTWNASVVQHSVVLVTKRMESALEVPSRKHLSQSCNSSRGTHPLLPTKDARTAAYSCRTNKSQIYFFACRGSKFFITSTSNKKLTCSVIKYNIHWLNLYWIANVENERVMKQNSQHELFVPTIVYYSLETHKLMNTRSQWTCKYYISPCIAKCQWQMKWSKTL